MLYRNYALYFKLVMRLLDKIIFSDFFNAANSSIKHPLLIALELVYFLTESLISFTILLFSPGITLISFRLAYYFFSVFIRITDPPYYSSSSSLLESFILLFSSAIYPYSTSSPPSFPELSSSSPY